MAKLLTELRQLQANLSFPKKRMEKALAEALKQSRPFWADDLQDGDEIVTTIAGLGSQRQLVVAEG